MNKNTIVLALLTFVASLAFSQQALTSGEYKIIASGITLSFSDFPTTNSWNGKNAVPILDTGQKHEYRTVISNAAKEPPNFDGKYKVVEFGCGTACQHFFIIDLGTGIVFDGRTTSFGAKYQLNSRLLIADPMVEIEKYWSGQKTVANWSITRYYLFGETGLRKILEINNAKE